MTTFINIDDIIISSEKFKFEFIKKPDGNVDICKIKYNYFNDYWNDLYILSPFMDITRYILSGGTLGNPDKIILSVFNEKLLEIINKMIEFINDKIEGNYFFENKKIINLKFIPGDKNIFLGSKNCNYENYDMKTTMDFVKRFYKDNTQIRSFIKPMVYIEKNTKYMNIGFYTIYNEYKYKKSSHKSDINKSAINKTIIYNSKRLTNIYDIVI